MEDQNQLEPALQNGEGRHDGQQLRRLLDKKGISVQEFADAYLQKSKAVAYAFLRKTEFTREELAMTCYLLNVHAQDFDYPENYLITNANKTRIGLEKNNVAAFHSLAQYDHDAIQGKKFIDDYFQDLIKYSALAEENLHIYHYLSKNKYQYRPHVLGLIQQYYQSVEQCMHQTPRLKYARYFALPFALTEPLDEMADPAANPGNKFTENEVLTHGLDIMLCETMRHLVYCLVHFPDRFTLYAIQIPTRQNSFTIVDNKYVISEYDRINRYRKVSHDIMFVDRIVSTVIDDPISMLLKVYTRDLENLKYNAEYMLRNTVQLEEIYKIVLEKFNYSNKEIQKLKDALSQQAKKQTNIFGEFNTDELERILKIKTQLAQQEERLKDWSEKLDAIKNVIASSV